MPLYEYQCQECGPFDAFRSLADRDKPLECQSCSGPTSRIFSPPTMLSIGLSGIRRPSEEPRVVKRSSDREPPKPQNTVKTGGRPWMFNH
ncbi:MAG: FmdB family zinc ribbon protein [Synechococcus sp.]